MSKRNKSLIFLLSIVAVILGSQVILSCCDPLTPPDLPKKPPVVEKELSPVIEVTVTPGGIVPYGDSVALRYNNSNTKMFWVDGQKQESPTEGTFISGPICRKTTFWLMATNVELTTKKYLDIKEVGPWYETTFGLVSYYPWEFIALIIFNDDELVLDYWIPDPSILGGISYFHQDGTVSYNFTTETATWSVPNENTLLINGFEKRLQVSREELVISYEITYSGKPAWFGMVYKHPSDVPTDPI